MKDVLIGNNINKIFKEKFINLFILQNIKKILSLRALLKFLNV
jgi:hypothetical protein